MLVAGGLTVALVAYLSGYAQMTSAGYQRARLQSERRSLLREQQALHSEILIQRNPDQVEAWAGQHGLVHVSAAPVALNALPASGQSVTRVASSRDADRE